MPDVVSEVSQVDGSLFAPGTRDLLVETDNPAILDRTVNSFGAAVVGGGMPGGYRKVGGAYIVRCFSNADFIRFAIENQGYGKVIKTCSGLYDEKEKLLWVGGHRRTRGRKMKLVLELSFIKATDDTMVRYCVEIKDVVLWQAVENLVHAITAVNLTAVDTFDIADDEEEKALQGDGKNEVE